MASKIASGGNGPATFVEAFGTSDPHTIDWRVFRGGTIIATSAAPNGFVVTSDGQVTVPVGTALGMLAVDVFIEEDTGDFPRGYGHYEFEVVCLTVNLIPLLQSPVDGVWTVKVEATPMGGAGPYQYMWHVNSTEVVVVAGGGLSNDFVTIKLSQDSEVSLTVTNSGGCTSPEVSQVIPIASMEALKPLWWPTAWAWPPSETPPADFPTCRPLEWPATKPPWLSNLYDWPWPATACFAPALYCVERTFAPSQVISLLHDAGIDGVTQDGIYFSIPANGRTLEQVRHLIEGKGIRIEVLQVEW